MLVPDSEVVVKRLIAVLLSVPFALAVVAAPAQALPKGGDPAQGCENTTTKSLAGYCATS